MKALLARLEEKFESIQKLKILALKQDEVLLTTLLQDSKLKETFFTQIRILSIPTPPPRYGHERGRNVPRCHRPRCAIIYFESKRVFIITQTWHFG